MQLLKSYVIETARAHARKRLTQVVPDAVVWMDFERWMNAEQKTQGGVFTSATVTAAKAIYTHYYLDTLNPKGDGP